MTQALHFASLLAADNPAAQFDRQWGFLSRVGECLAKEKTKGECNDALEKLMNGFGAGDRAHFDAVPALLGQLRQHVGEEGFVARAWRVIERVLQHNWPDSHAKILRLEILAAAMRLFARAAQGNSAWEKLEEQLELWNSCLRVNSADWNRLNEVFTGPQKGESLSAEDFLARVALVRSLLSEGTVLGRSRVFFPVVSKHGPQESESAGSIVAANITAVSATPDLLSNLPEESEVIVAPWTFYAPLDLNKTVGAFHSLQEVFGSLSKNLILPPTLRLIVDFTPLESSDLQTDAPAGSLWSLISPKLSFAGDSVGLAFAVAAWAAATNRVIRPLLATGAVVRDGGVSDVGGEIEKLAAAGRLRSVAKTPPRVAVPESWRHPFGGYGRNVGSLAALDRDFFLTDGFDDWRNTLASTDWNSAPASSAAADPETPAGLTTEEVGELQAALSAVLGELPQYHAAAVKSTRPALNLHLVTLPYGEAPAPIANWLVGQVHQQCQTLWGGAPLEQLPDFPVVLPVYLGELGAGPTQLSAAVAQAIATWTNPEGNKPGVAIEENALAVAARNAGKLVLVVYDRPSPNVSCWPAQTAGATEPEQLPQFPLLQAFAALAGRGHTVVVICSDLHHERLWRLAAGLPVPSAATAPGKGIA